MEGTFATHTSELISTGIVIVKRSKKVVNSYSWWLERGRDQRKETVPQLALDV